MRRLRTVQLGLIGWASLIGAALALCPSALAQIAARNAAATATLPESNEAMILSGRVEEALAAGDVRLAIRLVEQIMDLPAELVATPGSRTYYPVWRQAVRLLRRLPAAGVQAYRQLYDAEVAVRFQEAVAASDLNAIRELFRRFPISSSWPAIGQELIAQLLDRGAYSEALEDLAELTLAGSSDTPERKMQRIVALTRIGANDLAGRLLNELKNDAAAAAQPKLADRLARLAEFAGAAHQSSTGGDLVSDIRLGAVATGEPSWDVALRPTSDDSGLVDNDDALAEAVSYRRRLPLLRTAQADDRLFVRVRGRVWALDAVTLTTLWRADEPPTEEASEQGAADWQFAGGRVRMHEAENDGEPALSKDAQVLLYEPIRHAISSGFGLVLTIEPLGNIALDSAAQQARVFQFTADSSFPNELVARDARTGRVIWRIGRDPDDPLFNVCFQDAPLAIGAHLVVPVRIKEDLMLCALDPATGRQVSRTPIVGPPNYLPIEGGRCSLLADETTLYVATGNGVVAALSRDDLRWKWATVYASTLGEHLGMGMMRTEQRVRDAGYDRPVLAADLLILAPVDSPDIFALDRFSGQERWRIERGEYSLLLGAVEAGVLVGGNTLACLDFANGTTVRWRSVPLEITGMPAISGERVYVPTRYGIYALDARNGRVVADQFTRGALYAAGGPVTANLVLTRDALLSVSPGAITKYPDATLVDGWSERNLAIDAADERALIARAWLRILERRYTDALPLLENLKPADPGLAAARDRLLSQTFVALSRQARTDEARLDWLRRANALSLSPESAARLAKLIGQTLEESKLWQEALVHYRASLMQTASGLVTDESDAGYSVTQWVHAASRMGPVLRELPPQEADRFIDELVDQAAAAGKAETLMRLRPIIRDERRLATVDRALVLTGLPPELAVQYLPTSDDAALSLDIRRRLLLERWETHVALGMLSEATEDRDAWKRLAEAPGSAATAPAAAQAEGELDAVGQRVRRIERALEKLRQGVAAPFTSDFNRRWKRDRAELIADMRDPRSAMRPWLLVRDTDAQKRQIALLRDEDGRPMRETLDALQQGAAAEAARLEGISDLIGAPVQSWDPLRPAWPLVVYGNLAAVPTRGGLICVGLGPERNAGRRLWEREVPEWPDVPAEFQSTAAASAQAVFINPRKNRIAAVSWVDGQLLWQREIPGLTLRALFHAGDRLVLVGEGQQVLTVDALFGRDVRRLTIDRGAPRKVHVMGDLILVWTDDALLAFEAQTLEPRWTLAPGGDEVVEVLGREWVGYRRRGSAEWVVVDVHSGAPALPRGLGALGEVTALAVSEDRLYAATRTGSANNADAHHSVRLSAFDLQTGEELWNQTVENAVAVNGSQLLAHPEYVPTLLMSRPERPDELPNPNSLSIQLVQRDSGTMLEPRPIGRDFQQRQSGCEITMLVTRTRMIVQAGGTLAAFGNASANRGP